MPRPILSQEKASKADIERLLTRPTAELNASLTAALKFKPSCALCHDRGYLPRKRADLPLPVYCECPAGVSQETADSQLIAQRSAQIAASRLNGQANFCLNPPWLIGRLLPPEDYALWLPKRSKPKRSKRLSKRKSRRASQTQLSKWASFLLSKGVHIDPSLIPLSGKKRT